MGTTREETKEKKEIFRFEDHKQDQSTYIGRFRHFFDVINPIRFFVTSAQIREAQQKISLKEEVAKNLGFDIYATKSEANELLEYKKIVDSAIHPDTGEIIPFYCRMSGFVYFNCPILFGTLMCPQTPANIIFFQWINQSYNAGLNYGNRNASSPYTKKDIIRGYSGAVATALTISVSLNKIFSGVTSKMTGTKRFIVSTSFNWFAISLANAANCSLMRFKEIQEGISVKDESGFEYGKSKIVGKTALFQTIITRAFVPFCVMAGPATIISVMRNKNKMPKNKMLSILFEGSICALALGLSLPAAIALFPQEGKIKAENLEPEFHNLKDSHGKIVEEFYFNKGL
ncbi:unnamed protein product [Moneuplotes crassus]|uniref:Sidoreflexin n=1 Tax=Euplotes crassus TaxID=5936 RepID=A0AAD1XJS3_EUPCR|nr:unnamed protein product [Moneuplotes crassus]